MIDDVVTLYRPIGPKEFELLKVSSFKKWPPRLPDQPIFYPVTNNQYATEITMKWNVRDCGVGYVTKFNVNKAFMDMFEIKTVGADYHTEWWIPADRLEELNNNIVGMIEIVGEYRGNGSMEVK